MIGSFRYLRSQGNEADAEEFSSLSSLFERVAGMIGHDLNNALMIINSQCELLLDNIPQGNARSTTAQRIQNAIQKAVKLGEVLATFAGTRTAVEMIDFDSTVSDLIVVLKAVAANAHVDHSAGPGVKLLRLTRGLVVQVIIATVAAVSAEMTAEQPIVLHTGLLRWVDTNPAPGIRLKKGDYVWMTVVANTTSSDKPGANQHPETRAAFARALALVRHLVESTGGHLAIDFGGACGVSVTVYLPAFSWVPHDGGPLAEQIAGGAPCVSAHRL